MIEFPCHCGNPLSVPAELAGEVIQCPQCSRLNDVPGVGDLQNLDEDGVFKLGPQLPPPEDSATRLASVSRAFTRRHVDEEGEDIDLRNTFDDVLDSGTEDNTVLDLVDDLPVDAPRYDPLTGELVRPLDIKPDGIEPPIHPALIPVAQRAIVYAGVNDMPTALSFGNITMRLLQPVNILVMLIILVAHVLVTPINVMMGAGLFLVAPLWIFGMMFFLAHYGSVVDEIGPGGFDELPRPMRDFSLSEDIWRPFTHVAGSFVLCFGLAMVAYVRGAPFVAVYALAAAGTFFFPAVLLTLATSGSSLNLRPDRVLAVIPTIGAKYIVMIVAFVAACAAYYIGLWRLGMDLVLLFVTQSTATFARNQFPWWFEPWITYPLLIVGIYLAHWFCCVLGLAYRSHQPQFPWILQRHIATKLSERNRPSAQRDPNANSAKVRAKAQQPLAPPRVPR